MTQQLKRIAREPTDTQIIAGMNASIPGGSNFSHWMLPAISNKAYANLKDALAKAYQAMFDAAPAIESEAAKKALEFIAGEQGSTIDDAVEIIRALLIERKIK